MLDNLDFLELDIDPASLVYGGVGSSSTTTYTGVTVGPGYATAGAAADAKGINPQTDTTAMAYVNDWFSQATATADARTANGGSSSYSNGFASGGMKHVQNTNQKWG
jgi:hypothetical protein